MIFCILPSKYFLSYNTEDELDDSNDDETVVDRDDDEGALVEVNKTKDLLTYE